MEMARGAAQIYQGFYKMLNRRHSGNYIATRHRLWLPFYRSPNYQILARAILLHHKWNKILEYLK